MSLLSTPRATTKGLLILRRVQVGYHDARGDAEGFLDKKQVQIKTRREMTLLKRAPHDEYAFRGTRG